MDQFLVEFRLYAMVALGMFFIVLTEKGLPTPPWLERPASVTPPLV